jgi:hypothetical protein
MWFFADIWVAVILAWDSAKVREIYFEGVGGGAAVDWRDEGARSFGLWSG